MDVTPQDEAYTQMMALLETASMELLQKRALLRRTDSKFLLSPAQLARVVAEIAESYRLVRSGGHARSRYETLYFDTPELRCFHDHRRGRRPRHKVRCRHYPERGLSYLEVKTKHNEYTTHKHRRALDFGDNDLSGAELEFISAHCDLPPQSLRPRVWTNFWRSTLVGVDTTERITVDTNLELVRGDRVIQLANVVIMEVKQAHFDVRSPVMLALRGRGLQSVSASKYCTASVLHDRDLRFNRLKPAIRRVARLSEVAA